jgi:hypothetical protein
MKKYHAKKIQGGTELKFRTFWNSTLNGVTGQLHAPAVSREKGPLPPAPVDCISTSVELKAMTKIPAITWNRTPAIQPVSSRGPTELSWLCDRNYPPIEPGQLPSTFIRWNEG